MRHDSLKIARVDQGSDSGGSWRTSYFTQKKCRKWPKANGGARLKIGGGFDLLMILINELIFLNGEVDKSRMRQVFKFIISQQSKEVDFLVTS